MRRCSISKYIDESLPHGQVIHLGHRREELPEESHLQRRIFRSNLLQCKELTIRSSGAWSIELTIHLTPGVLERPRCRFTNDVWCVNRNREGSAMKEPHQLHSAHTRMLQSSEEEKHTDGSSSYRLRIDIPANWSPLPISSISSSAREKMWLVSSSCNINAYFWLQWS